MVPPTKAGKSNHREDFKYQHGAITDPKIYSIFRSTEPYFARERWLPSQPAFRSIIANHSLPLGR
jgi:hypothetical protein